MSRAAAMEQRGEADAALSLPPDAGTKRRARKVWWLCMHGQTDGEVGAGRARMEEMAGQHGMTLAAFVEVCGLIKPRVRVKAGRGPLAG